MTASKMWNEPPERPMTADRAALVEKVAEAICTVDEQNGGPPWGYVKSKGGDFLQSFYDKAEAAIRALKGSP